MSNYFIYPYTYKQLDDAVLLINDCAEFVFLSKVDFNNFISDINKCGHDVVQKLKEKFFITPTEKKQIVDSIRETKILTKHSYLTNDGLLLMVVPTINCNCSCVYCQVNSRFNNCSKEDLSFQSLVNFCTFAISLPHKDIKIEFQGGEPLLAFDQIKFIVKRLSKLNRKISKTLSYVVCTNLLALKKSHIKFLKKYDIQISTSIDGCKDIHDANRPSRLYKSTFEKTLENINLLKNNGIYPSALVTITNVNLNNMKAIVDEYIRLGFSGIFLRPLNNYGMAFRNSNIKYSASDFLSNYKKAVEYIIELKKTGVNIKEEYFTILLRKLYSPFNDGFVDMQNPCALGQMCMIVDQKGDIYPSDEARMISEMGDQEWRMGNINNKDCFVSMKHIQDRIKINGEIEEVKHCKNCAYRKICFTDPIRDWYIEKYSHDNYCELKEGIFDFLFMRIKNADKEEERIFWEWANE